MFLPSVNAPDLHLAFTYKVYLRWHTHRLRPLPALAALTLSTGVSYGVAWLLFDRIWRFNLGAGLLMLVAATLVSALTALVAADSVIRRKPTALLG